MLIDLAYRAAKPLLFRLDAETVHERVIGALGVVGRSDRARALLARAMATPADERLTMDVFGRRVRSPLGIAAGLDKNAVAAPALFALGFGAVEVGTVTLRPQEGNDRPRLFRLPAEEALINRMGFPGEGVDDVERRLQRLHRPADALLGVNIGPNKETVAAGLERVAQECAEVLRRLGPLADYAVINVSSPNTAQLRDLQGRAALAGLLRRIQDNAVASTPLLVKIAPDLSERELDEVVTVVEELGLAGIVATNTTLARPPSLTGRYREERGGLSGRPLADRTRAVVRNLYRRSGGRLPILAAGGIFSGRDVADAIAAGATLCQVYTGFIYRGPAMAPHVQRELLNELERRGVPSLAALRGSDA